MNPDDFIYIYELAGTLSEPQRYFDQSFVAHWREGESTFLFFSRPQGEALEILLKDCPQVAWTGTHQMRYQDWQGEESTEVLEIGKLLILPPGKEAPEGTDRVPIRIDPGVVFGSGHHPTTRGCLSALLRVFDQDKPGRVLDLGTGTGILSVASARLGASDILAVDWNPACVQTARRNIRLNGLEGLVTVEEGLAEETIKEPAEMLIANIHFAVIKELIGMEDFYRKKWVVVSGLLRSEYKEVQYRLSQAGFKFLDEWESDFTWFTLLGTNP